MQQYVKGLDPVPILAEVFHNFGQSLLLPFGYEKNKNPDNLAELVSAPLKDYGVYYSMPHLLFLLLS